MGCIVCWDPYPKKRLSPLTPREIVEFSAGDESACWLLPDSTVACWGGMVFASPQGTFQSVSVGDAIYRSFACGVRTNGELACWGGNGHDAGNVFPPEGTFKSVSPGYIHGCAIKMDDSVACWGAIGDHYGSRGVPSSGPFRSLGGGNGGGGQCGIRPDDTLECWGGLDALPGTFQSVSVGVSRNGVFYCGIRTDGTLPCAGTGHYGETTPPAGRFQLVSAGWRHVCGVRVDGAVACWGSNTDYWDEVMGQAEPPAGKFVSVSAGHNYTCGIRTDRTLACWGRVPEVLQNLSGIKPPHPAVPEPTPTPDIWSLPLRDQLEWEKQQPGNLVANVGGSVEWIYRVVGMMTEAEREAMAKETQLFFEELGPPKGKAKTHTYARIWLDFLEAIALSVEEFNYAHTFSEYRARLPFYVFMPAYLPPGFRSGGIGASGGHEESYGTIFIHLVRSSETNPQLGTRKEQWLTIIKGTDPEYGMAGTIYQHGGGEEVEFPNLKEAGARDARYWVGHTSYRGSEKAVQVAWVNPESDSYTHVISDLSLEETLKVVRSMR